MCDSILMLDGAELSSPGELRALGFEIADNVPDNTCLCGLDVGRLFLTQFNKHRFLRKSYFFSAWQEVDDEGRTHSDAYFVLPDPESDFIDHMIERGDWPHGFKTEKP